MQSKATTPDQYIAELPEERMGAVQKIREILNQNLPKGFQETMGYGMLAYVVPLETYPDGYHCNPKLPLPFINVASQKNFIALYHSGIYSDPKLLEWFTSEYPKYVKTKLDMGKSCVRFKKVENIPYALIAELATKMTPQDWIDRYEAVLKT